MLMAGGAYSQDSHYRAIHLHVLDSALCMGIGGRGGGGGGGGGGGVNLFNDQRTQGEQNGSAMWL